MTQAQREPPESISKHIASLWSASIPPFAPISVMADHGSFLFAPNFPIDHHQPLHNYLVFS